jgi:MFS family permease
MKSIGIITGDRKHYFTSFTLRLLGFGMVFLFIPAHLHDHGYAYQAIGTFYIIMALAHAATAIIAGKIAKTKGLRWLFSTGLILGIAFLTLLPQLGEYHELFVPAALLGGISGGLFWVPYHLYLATRTSKGTRGTTIGVLWIVTGIASMIAPAIGGIITETAGAKAAMMTAAIIMALSLIPLYRTEEIRTRSEADITGVLRDKKSKGFLAAGVATAGAAMLWPLLFYHLLGGYAALGIIAFATNMIGMATSLAAGKHYDKNESRTFLKAGSGLQAMTLIARIAAVTPIIGIVIDAADKIVQRLFWLGVDAESYKRNDDDHDAIIKREFWIQLGIALLFATFAVTESFTTTFLVAAAGSLLVLLL